MTTKARAVLTRVALVDLYNYNTVKTHMLKEFKLIPRSKFMDAVA